MTDQSAYNDLPHFMQSEAFGNYMERIGWRTTVVGKSKKVFIYTKKLPGLGTMAKIPKISLPVPFEQIEDRLRGDRLMLLRLEPNVVLPEDKKKSATLMQRFYAHGYTNTWRACELAHVRVPLSNSQPKLLAAFPRENTRRNIRTAQKYGLTAEESSDLKLFYELHRYTAKSRHFYCPPFSEIVAMWESFAKKNGAKLVITRTKAGKPVAGIFLVLFQKIAYYRYVGALDEGMPLRAPTFAAWQAMLLAKYSGCEWFDFMGVNDERGFDRTWQGFSHFKLGFSNKPIRLLIPIAKYYGPIGRFMQFFDTHF